MNQILMDYPTLPQAIEQLTLVQDEATEPPDLSLPRVHEKPVDFVSLPIG